MLNHRTEHAHLVGHCVNSATLWTLTNAPAVLQAISSMRINASLPINVQWEHMQTLQLQHVKIVLLDVLRAAMLLT